MLSSISLVAAQNPTAPVRDVPLRVGSSVIDGSATIKGRIIDAAGRPLRGVEVAAFPMNLRGYTFSDLRMALTDLEGRYALSELASGPYRVGAGRFGYINGAYGQTRPLDPFQTVWVSSAATVALDDIILFKGGVISGNVIDQFGEPVTGVTARALRRTFEHGIATLSSVGQSANPTDDLGAFVIGNLPAGDYIVLVSHGGFYSHDGTAFQTTYYPGVPSLAGAQVVRIETPDTRTTITVPVTASRTSTISGTVVDAGGQLVRGARVAYWRQMPGSANGSSTDSTDGTFVLSHLTPGEYLLPVDVHVSRRSPAGARKGHALR